MPEPQTSIGSEYSQTSFSGGMNMLGDDSRLPANQYRVGFDLTNRLDILDPVLESKEDFAAPAGLKQEMVTFGEFVVLFVAGFAYYRHYTATGWKQITGFQMSPTAPRYWTVLVPLATTNYYRLATTSSVANAPDPSAVIKVQQLSGSLAGDIPGMLVQDNINQPQFIFLNETTGIPEARTTQSFSQWSITFTDASNTVVATDGDKREYVPIGNVMAWEDGVLYIASQDGELILRSVSGRPLDFAVAVTNDTAAVSPFTQQALAEASQTAYSVGVGGITCIRAVSSGGIFVSASGANFLVTKNKTPGAPTIYGEYTFIRTFLFNATCLSDRTIIDTLGDTRFISLTGIRSFNAVAQTQNEGENLPFSATIQGAFGTEDDPILQSAEESAAILYNDYELYAMNTIFGNAICKFDTINKCWVSFDIQQAGGRGIKQFASIEFSSVKRLYAITDDDKLYTLYIGPNKLTASFRSVGICANILYAGSNVRMANPKNEIKLLNTRVILNKITADCSCSFTPYVNNRQTQSETQTKQITYEDPPIEDNSANRLPDVNTQLMNILFSTPNCDQGWKVFCVFSWTGGSFTQFSLELQDLTPMNPLNSQELSQ